MIGRRVPLPRRMAAHIRYLAALPARQLLTGARPTPEIVAEDCDVCGQPVYVPVEECGGWLYDDDRMAAIALREHAIRAGHAELAGGDHVP